MTRVWRLERRDERNVTEKLEIERGEDELSETTLGEFLNSVFPQRSVRGSV